MDNSQLATKADIQTLEQSTKEEIKKLTTKKELSAVKSELKADIKAVKVDVKSLRQDVLRIEERVENLEEGQAEMQIKLDKIINTLDGFVGVVDDLRTDNTVGTHHAHELQRRVDDHDKRLKLLESAKAIV